jgi:hypothetical protein
MNAFAQPRFWWSVATLATLVAMRIGAAQAPSVRAGSGVRIVEHESIRNAPVAFRFASTPFYDVGGLNDDPRLELTAGTPWEDAIRLSDGRVVTAEAHELRVFGADGKYIRTIGRKGQGPGEFPNQVGVLCRLRGDSILVLQYGGVRATVFTPDGGYVRMTPLSEPVPRFACTEDGRVLTQAIPTDVVAYRAAGASTNDPYTFVDTRTSQIQTPPIATFRTSTFKSMEPWNTTIAIHGDRIYVANADVYEVSVYTLAGALVQVLRVREKPPAFTDTDALTGRDMPRSIRPATHLAFGDVRIDRAGRIWIEDHQHGGNPLWTVFDPNGQILGRVALPTVSGGRKAELISVGVDDALIAVRLEEDAGAVRFRLYKFARP